MKQRVSHSKIGRLDVTIKLTLKERIRLLLKGSVTLNVDTTHRRCVFINEYKPLICKDDCFL